MISIKKLFSISILLLCILTTTVSVGQIKKSITGITNSANNSSIIDFDMPANLNPGQEYVVTMNILNTGTNIWTMNDGYHLALYDQVDNKYMSDVWDVKQVALPYDVYPSQKVNFLFKIKAPLTSGMYNTNWAMVKNNEFFGEYNTSTINVGGDIVSPKITVYENNNAEFVEQTIPSTMVAGETYKILLSMKNTGQTAWLPSSSGDYRVAFFSDAADNSSYPNWNTSPVYVSQTIDPGQTALMEFYVTAPSTTGVYNMQWMMQKGSNYFGQRTLSHTVNVVGGNNIPVKDATMSYGSNYIDQSIPNSMTVNKEYKISVTMSNTGKQTWIKGREQLVLIDARMSPMSLNSWNVGYVQLTQDVPPGTLVTFEFDVKPMEKGWQHLQWIMMNGEGTTFGSPTQAIQVIVANSSN